MSNYTTITMEHYIARYFLPMAVPSVVYSSTRPSAPGTEEVRVRLIEGVSSSTLTLPELRNPITGSVRGPIKVILAKPHIIIIIEPIDWTMTTPRAQDTV